MARLIFDIETVGDDFDSFDETTQEVLTRWIKKESKDEKEYQVLLDGLKNELGFSPLTGKVVAIGVMDYEKDKGAVYFDAPGENIKEFSERKFTYKPMGEKEMLENFWRGAENYDEFITFSGRSFDVPFLVVRSAIHGVNVSKRPSFQPLSEPSEVRRETRGPAGSAHVLRSPPEERCFAYVGQGLWHQEPEGRWSFRRRRESTFQGEEIQGDRQIQYRRRYRDP